MFYKKLYLFFGILILISTFSFSANASNENSYFGIKNYINIFIQDLESIFVIKVIDGDTILAQFPDGHSQQIRLLGINTPDFEGEDFESDECYAKESKQALKELFKDTRWGYVESDLTNRDEDDIKRKLRYIYINNGNRFVDVSEYLVTNGFAYVFDKYPSIKKVRYRYMQALAKKNKLNIWKECPK